METSLRCNALKCRASLTQQAVVTTCSHIFCLDCSRATGLADSSSNGRICPACDTKLGNPDDVVVTQLDPSEDYKTSVLSGLSPSIIVECAGRGLAFYAYQAAQEIVYQEFLAKGLSERHTSLSSQMDQIIHDANAEILGLRNKLSALQLDNEGLRSKYQDLNNAHGEKIRAHARTQKLYDTLKKQMLQLDVQSAAVNAASQDIGSSPGVAGRHMSGHSQFTRATRPQRGSTGSSSGSGGPRAAQQHNSRLDGSIHFSDTRSFGALSNPVHHRTRLPFTAVTAKGIAHDSQATHAQQLQSSTFPNRLGPIRQPLGSLDPSFITNARSSDLGSTSTARVSRLSQHQAVPIVPHASLETRYR